jgi:uncharacterized protein (UPF0332 family)
VAQDLTPHPPALHLAKAAEALREARVLAAAAAWEGATSSVYYACLHAARGLLASIGVVAETHKGTQTLLGLHFVKDGTLAGELLSDFGRLMADRHLADYGLLRAIGERRARENAATAAVFLRAILALTLARDPGAAAAAEAVRDELGALEAALGPG